MKMIFLNKAIENKKKIIQPPWKSQITWVSFKKLSPTTILKKQFLFINYVKAEYLVNLSSHVFHSIISI